MGRLVVLWQPSVCFGEVRQSDVIPVLDPRIPERRNLLQKVEAGGRIPPAALEMGGETANFTDRYGICGQCSIFLLC